MKHVLIGLALLLATVGCRSAELRSPVADPGKAPTLQSPLSVVPAEPAPECPPVYRAPVPHVDSAGRMECDGNNCRWIPDPPPAPCPAKQQGLPGYAPEPIVFSKPDEPCLASVADAAPDEGGGEDWGLVTVAGLALVVLCLVLFL